VEAGGGAGGAVIAAIGERQKSRRGREKAPSRRSVCVCVCGCPSRHDQCHSAFRPCVRHYWTGLVYWTTSWFRLPSHFPLSSVKHAGPPPPPLPVLLSLSHDFGVLAVFQLHGNSMLLSSWPTWCFNPLELESCAV
jgi:hypothetical protein